MPIRTPQSRFNVPLFFWLCFGVAFSVTALAPVWAFADGLFLFRAYELVRGLPWKPTVAAHTSVATLVAAISTMVIHRISNQQPPVRQIRLSSLMLLAAGFAIGGAVLRGSENLPWVYGCAVIPFLGCTGTCLLAARIRPNTAVAQR